MNSKAASNLPTDAADQRALLAMFRSIPVSKLRETAMSLLGATRTVRTSKAIQPGSGGVERPDTIQEPDSHVRLRTLELIVEQRAGAASWRKPIELSPDKDEEKPGPWLLKGRSIPARPGLVPPRRPLNPAGGSGSP